MIERDINVVGPLARDAADLDLALSVLAGPMSQEALGWHAPLPPPSGRTLRQLRVAAWLDDPTAPVDATVRSRLEALVKVLVSAGVAVDAGARPSFDFEEAFDLFLELLRIRPDEVTTHADWLRLDQRRQALRDRWAEFFESYDVLLCPVCSTPPFPHDQRPREQRQYLIDGAARPLTDYVRWVGIVGLAYLPSTVAPLGVNAAGLPVGVQIVGPHLSDRRTIEVAGQLAEVIGGFARPGGLAT